MKFNELIKNEKILKSISENGFVEPTQIQEEIMPFIIDGKDVLGQSQTGTGKTLAFSGPILDNIVENRITQTLILAPTRELALQIARDIENYGKYTNIHIECVYGSSSITDQIRALSKGVEIVIGTPGRVKDLINRKKLKLSEIKYFVLDEADEMLSMGFQEELEFIFKSVNNDKQVLLFSATMPKKIKYIAENYMSSEYETVIVKSDHKTSDHVSQEYYLTTNQNRCETLSRIFDFNNFKRVIIFVRTKRNADELLERMSKKEYNANVIHGDITQAQRIKTLDLFKAGAFNYLIATDVAARGIHVDDVELVVNYNLPESKEAYIHRIGRTGRANKFGISITLVTDKEEKFISELESYTNSKMEKKTVYTEEAILNNKIENLTEEIDLLVNTNNKINIDGYLDNLSNEEIKKLAINLLEEKVMGNLGSDFSVNLKEPRRKKEKQNSRNLKDSVRVFLTIGKLDNINKRELLTFIEKKTGFKEGTCTGVEILSKFTFMNVKKESYDLLYKKCNNSTFNNRLIRIEKAK